MSELINNDPLPEDDLDIESGQSSGAMVVTMLLLIGCFLLSSALLMQRTLQARSPDGNPVFSLSALAEKSTSMMKAAPQEQPDEPTVAPFEGIKQLVIEKTSSDNVRWPRLRLTGFGRSADGSESFAYINGDLVHPGEYAGKIKLLEVRNHDVVVEYKGEQRILTEELP